MDVDGDGNGGNVGDNGEMMAICNAAEVSGGNGEDGVDNGKEGGGKVIYEDEDGNGGDVDGGYVVSCVDPPPRPCP